MSLHHKAMLFVLTFVPLLQIVSAQQPFSQEFSQDLPTQGTERSASSELPPPPGGKSTVIGGQIHDLDPVRDQFVVKVYGGQSIKVLFDERTAVYRDGKKVGLRDLQPGDQASVETTLDGAKIFALRIHLLSQSPEGQWRGRVVSYKPQLGELILNVGASQKPITLHVPPDVPIALADQDGIVGPALLKPGSIVDVKFRGRTGGNGTVTRINIFGAPGSTFVFTGSLSFLDLDSGRLAVLDPHNSQTHQVEFAPSRFPISRELHQGSGVKVVTIFDGERYVATEIASQ